MWRYQVGCLEMVLSYFKEKVEDAGHQQTLRDFLFDVLSCHDQMFSKPLSSKGSEEATPTPLNVEASEATPDVEMPAHSENVEADDECQSIFNCRLEPVSLKTLPESRLDLKVNNSEDRTSEPVEPTPKCAPVKSVPEASVPVVTNWNIKTEADSEEKDFEAVGRNFDVIQPSSELPTFPPTVQMDLSDLPPWPGMPSRLHISGGGTDQQSPLPPRFTCTFCPRVFASCGQKQMHERSHLKARPFICSFCGKSFTSKNGKVIHERMHTNERPFSCAYCPRTFYQNCDKLKHERTHTKEKPYTCAYCMKQFSDASSKIRHERLHRNERLHACAFCPKAFACSGSRRAHERKHRLERPFACLLCPKTFGDNEERLAHEKEHQTGAE